MSTDVEAEVSSNGELKNSADVYSRLKTQAEEKAIEKLHIGFFFVIDPFSALQLFGRLCKFSPSMG